MSSGCVLTGSDDVGKVAYPVEDNRIIEIRVGDGHSMFCKAQKLIENSKYFENMLTLDTEENACNIVELSFQHWGPELCAFLTMLSSGISQFSTMTNESLIRICQIGTYFRVSPQFLDLPKYLKSLQLSVFQTGRVEGFTRTRVHCDYLEHIISQGGPACLEMLLQWLDAEANPEEVQRTDDFFFARNAVSENKLFGPWTVQNLKNVMMKYPVSSNIIEPYRLMRSIVGANVDHGNY